MRKVSVDIVTGFLGSGKTTLLSHLLGSAREGEKIAVVMNEIGDIGIDGRVVTGMDYVENVVELNSGCICCTIDDYRFDLAIQELIENVDPTLIVIETTGLADPEPTIYRVKQSGLGLDAVITVVDAENVERMLAETTVARPQIQAADFLVLNKTDLRTERELRRLSGRLRRLNRRALLMETEYGRVESDILFGTSVRRWREREETGSAGHEGPEPRSGHLALDHVGVFSYQTEASFDLKRFERFLEKVPRSVYRAKGFVRFEGNDWIGLFSLTCGRFELNWVRLSGAAPATQAVFIGRDIDDVRDRLLADLERCRTE